MGNFFLSLYVVQKNLISTSSACKGSLIPILLLDGVYNGNVGKDKSDILLSDEAVTVEVVYVKRQFNFSLQITVVDFEKAMHEFP